MAINIPKFESVTVEFKREWNVRKDGEPIKKTLVAFANTAGGDIFIGVDDDGTVVGLEDVGAIEEKVSSAVRDNISPSLIGLLSTERMTDGNVTVLRVHVDVGDMKPYCLDPKNGAGVYIRVGNTTVPASMDDIARMVRESNPVPFEQRTSTEQDLTFNYCRKFCLARNVEFDPKLNTTYGFWNRRRSAWTNLARICSDQSPASVVLVRFQNNEKTIILDSERVTGSVFELYDRATAFIAQSNYAWMEKPSSGSAERIDHYIIDPRVILEALVNALVHRDYSKTPANLIHITPASIELKSIGGLAEGLSIEDVAELMATECRNAGLAHLFGRLHLMENKGSGFTRIQEFYGPRPIRELLRLTETSFTIILPRLMKNVYMEKPLFKDVMKVVAAQSAPVSRQFIQDALGISRTKATGLLNEMKEKNLIEAVGGSRSIRYKIKNS